MASTSTSTASKSKKESLEDCMCSICLSILVHPVTLPCRHELCMPCFKHTVEEANLACPLCRIRISTWARKASRTNTLVDQKRWEQIQRLFPGRVQRRLDGLDDDTDEEIKENDDIGHDEGYRHMIQLSAPGEIRKEYEEEIKRLQAQQAAERQEEEEASASLIQHLCCVEEQRLSELRRQQEEIAARDAQLAQELDKLSTESSETPVIRLLQVCRVNYPNLPVFPSTPTVNSSQDGSHINGKHPQTKNSNTTLETFFRRLPAGSKRSVRSASFPNIGGGSEATERKSCTDVVFSCSQSTPVTGKENQPVFRTDASDAADLGVSDCFTGDGSRHSSRDVEEVIDTCVLEEKRVEVADTHDDRQKTVEIVDLRQERAGSTLTIHSDGSESVSVYKEQEAVGEKNEEVKGDSHFKPIHPFPCTPPHKLPNPFVCITPRNLFSTNCLTSFFRSVTSSSSDPLASRGGTGEFVEDLSYKRTGEHIRVQNRSIEDMGSKTSKLFRAEAISSSSCRVSDIYPDQAHCSKRARSTSPPTPRRSVHCPQGYCEELKGCCRPSLQELRTRRMLKPDIEEVVSDSEVGSPSHYRLRPGHLAMGRALRGGGQKEAWGMVRCRYADKDSEFQSSESEPGEGRHHQSRSADYVAGQACMRSTVYQGAVAVGSAPSASDVGRKASAFPICEDSPPESPTLSQQPVPNQQRPSPRPLGIFNPDTVPPWSGSLYIDSDAVGSGSLCIDSDAVGSGKGKRLMKRSGGSCGGLSYRNCAKSSRKASVNEEDSGHGFHCKALRIRHDFVLAESSTEDVQSITTTRSSEAVTSVGMVCRPERCQVSRLPALEKTPESDLTTNTVDRHRAKTCVPDAVRLDRTSKTTVKSCRRWTISTDIQQTKATDKQKTESKLSAADKTALETAVNFNRAQGVGKKTYKSSIGQKSEASGFQQRSIKDWFSPSQSTHSEKATQPSHSCRKAPIRREKTKTSEVSVMSDMSNPSSSASEYPSQLRTSQRVKKLSPKLDDFMLMVSGKLTQYRVDIGTDSDDTSMSSPSKTHTPTKSLKRRSDEHRARGHRPVKKISQKQSIQKRQQASTEGRRPGRPGQSSQLKGDYAGHKQRKQAPCALGAGGEDSLSAGEKEEEGLSQEEMDRRLAEQLQQQFHLADKLNLQVVRFKGSDNEYSLRIGRSQTSSSEQ